jgi:hypothetical protein
VAAVSHRARLAVLKDAKVDVTALSEPIERWMGEPPPGLVSNGKLKLVEKDEPPTEPIESNERFDSDSKEERRRQEELQQAEARQAAFDIGVDTCTPVDDKDYQVPFHFAGKIGKVTFKLGPTLLTSEDHQITQHALAKGRD